MRRLHDSLTVDTDWTEVSPDFTINNVGVYPLDGNIEFEILDEDSNWILNQSVNQGDFGFELYDCIRVRFRAVSGSVTINYTLQGYLNIISLVESIPLEQFSYDSNQDIEPVSIPIFLSDDKGDLMPSVDGTVDKFFEIVSNDITPKE